MTLVGFVWRDLVRNPRRTLASLVGVLVGVGLFSAVLFFIDGSGASMTRRALAPLTLDVQRVLTAPPGGGIRLERAAPAGALPAGAATQVTLTVRNEGLAPAHDVVVRDRPTAPLEYVPGSTSLDGVTVPDVGRDPAVWQGAAGTGLNLGTVPAGQTRTLRYQLRATSDVPDPGKTPVLATISSREAVHPARADAPRPVPVGELAARVAPLPGVAAADPLVFVDLDPGAISAGGAAVPGPTKLFAFDAAYVEHYPSIRLQSGAVRPDGALVSAETAEALGLRVGDPVSVRLPGTVEPLSLPVTGVVDLSAARPLFESRQASQLEKFVYVPYTVVVGHDTYATRVAPAFEAAAAVRGTSVGSRPLEELDILLDRSRLDADPATALTQTSRVAAAVREVAPEQDYLVDNASNTLEVARGDAAVAKRMFVFLGLPGALLAALLTAYAGRLLAGAQRRETALLRVRGASGRHLLRLLGLRTLALAGTGSVLGTGLGLASVLVLLGPSLLFEASPAALLQSAAIGVVGGMLVTALALYLPGRRLIAQEIRQELAVEVQRGTPGRRRLHLDLLALVGAVAAQVAAVRLGAFEVPAGSVYEGRSVSLPLQLLVAPIVAWLAGTLLLAHLLSEVTARTAGRRAAVRFDSLVPGVLWRSITRRLAALTGGVVTVGLVVGLGTMLACFATVYDSAKAVDARFLVGSDLRLVPDPTGSAAHPVGLAAALDVPGATGATPVVYSPENTSLTSSFNEDVASLAAIDPDTFGAVAALPDSVFVRATADAVMARMRAEPTGILVNVALADGLKLRVGDPAHVLLARGTDQQSRTAVRVVGLFSRFPGAPTGTDVVAHLGAYQQRTGLSDADYYLVATADHSAAGVRRVAQALQARPGVADGFTVQTSAETVDRDQSSLTALNVRGLLELDSLYTFLMATTATAMFVFGLLMQRRREYVTLRAQGLDSREVRLLVLAEAGLCSTIGAAIGVGVGIAMASQFVSVLRPIFTIAPPLAVPPYELAVLVALVLGATAVSAAVAAALIGRLRPTELLRDE